MNTKILRVLIHTYMFVSSLMFVLLIPMQDTVPFLYDLGGNSWFISVGLVFSGTLTAPVGIIMLLWTCAFPILLVVFYIMARKENYLPFCVLVAMDALVVMFWYVSCLVDNNQYALMSARNDAVVSVLFAIVLIGSLCVEKSSQEDIINDRLYSYGN